MNFSRAHNSPFMQNIHHHQSRRVLHLPGFRNLGYLPVLAIVTVFSNSSVNLNSHFLLKNLSKRPRYAIPLGLACGLAPAMALIALFHRHTGPDIGFRNANCEPWNRFENKQYRYYTTIDHVNYQHPRPKF
ncbi:hypothetical protein TYRP_010555 [Tyrophagus putrescentiae]|nr:hypothetical protein TYRP_010555 [Tyrophagus putrescentiae]